MNTECRGISPNSRLLVFVAPPGARPRAALRSPRHACSATDPSITITITPSSPCAVATSSYVYPYVVGLSAGSPHLGASASASAMYQWRDARPIGPKTTANCERGGSGKMRFRKFFWVDYYWANFGRRRSAGVSESESDAVLYL